MRFGYLGTWVMISLEEGEQNSTIELNMKYTNSLINVEWFYANFNNTAFQWIPIPHLTHTMKRKLKSFTNADFLKKSFLIDSTQLA